ncbi:MAG: hypothetical protein NVS2B16_00750 [Chloroflexota bacterium]
MLMRFVAAIAAVTLFAATEQSSAFAHASLQACSIKNNQVFSAAHAPSRVTATFAEPLEPSKSWINVFEGVADHGLVNENFHSRVSFKNPKQLTLTLPRLHPGTYYLMWYTHSAADNHFAAGIVYFRVK